MQWDDMRVFLAVARDGSISGACKQLGVQHSTVSRRLRSLEQNLGSALIERKKTGHELTPAGEELKLTAEKMELEVLEFENTLGGLDHKATGKLCISAINNMASTIMMPMFTSFSAAYPGIELHVRVSNKFVSLAERQADIAIRLTNTPQDTLIGCRLVTVASTIYGARDVVNAVRAGTTAEQWLGIECCGFHMSWNQTGLGPEQAQLFFCRRHFTNPGSAKGRSWTGVSTVLHG